MYFSLVWVCKFATVVFIGLHSFLVIITVKLSFNSALNILCHNEVTLNDVLKAFPEELSFMKDDKALCHRLEIEGLYKFTYS